MLRGYFGGLMATRNYWAVFGSGAPSTTSGLAPTFISFISSTGAAGTAPAISEPGSKGLYLFAYDASATMIAFVMDGATTGLATSDRYISGVLDPYDTFGVTLNAIGTTLIAQGATIVAFGGTLTAQGTVLANLGTTTLAQGVLITGVGTTLVAQGSTLVGTGNTLLTLSSYIGSTASSFGSTSVDPTTLFGFLKRAQDLSEGNNTYVKSTGVLSMLSRGSSTLLATKTISDTSSQTTKT